MAELKIATWVDWGKSFVDEDGNFYCGTTIQEKQNARKISEGADIYLYLGDFHTRSSSEFTVNGGLYPAHNLIARDNDYNSQLGVPECKTTSPQLTDILLDMVKDKRSGLIVPRHVFFQDYDGQDVKDIKPAFNFQDVEKTYGVKRLNPVEFLDGGIEYIVNAKHMFNGAGLQSTEWIGHVENIPQLEMNIFTLLKQKYGQGKGLQFDIDGVVMGICIYQTASGIKQIFPKAEVNIIADASTHLLIKELGFSEIGTADAAIKNMCKQVGLNYTTTAEYLGMK